MRLLGLAALADGRRGGSVAGYYELGREARGEVARSMAVGDKEGGRLWGERLRELGVCVVNALVEEGDLVGAVGKVRAMRRGRGERDGETGRWLVLLYLRMGDVGAARGVLAELKGSGEEGGEGIGMLEALVRICEGDYEGAVRLLEEAPQTELGTANRALTLFYTGRVEEAVKILEDEVGKGRVGKEVVFNLATCYELTGERDTRKRKEDLASRVRGKVGEKAIVLGQADFKL